MTEITIPGEYTGVRFYRVYRPGWVRNSHGNDVPVFLRAEIGPNNHGDARLSIVGVEGPRRNGNCWGGCGQIREFADDIVRWDDGWNPQRAAEFAALWDRWHLNDMQAACDHQRALGWTWSTHPSEPCPECGYRLGSAWLIEPLPDDIVTQLESWPASPVTPAWV